MKYLKIKNKGELDIRLICLMGASTKTEDATKIGQFGTGLKYAISFMLRNKIPFRLFCGAKEVHFSTEVTEICGKDFEEIFCNGTTMNITTAYGYQWKAWEALREIWCNAMDEGADKKSTVDNRHLAGQDGYTIFYIAITEQIKEVLDKWDSYFINQKPLVDNDQYAIYSNTGKLKLYKHGVLIFESAYHDSLFAYDIKEATLNELRQFMGSVEWSVCSALVNSSKNVISQVLTAISENKNVYEKTLNWQYVSGSSEHMREIFAGFLFLHPSSSGNAKSKSAIVVNQSLYDLLKKNGLPCERVLTSSGGYYGGGGLGYGKSDKMEYKPISNPSLQAKIIAIGTKYGSSMQFQIVVPLKEDFDMLFDGRTALFNSALDQLSQADLEATVLIAVLHATDDSIYKAFKRCIKAALVSRNFKKIMFGSRSGTGKPVYKDAVEVKPVTDDYIPLPFKSWTD